MTKTNTPQENGHESCVNVVNEHGKNKTVLNGSYAQERLTPLGFEIGHEYDYILNGKTEGTFTVIGITDELGIDKDVSQYPDIVSQYVDEMKKKPGNTTLLAKFSPEGNTGVLDYLDKIKPDQYKEKKTIGDGGEVKTAVTGIL